MSKFLTKEQILKINDLETKDFYVKEWKATVRIRTLSSRERDKFEREIFGGVNKQANLENFRAKLVSLTLIDPNNGERMFTSEKDVTDLGNKSASALDSIFAEAQKLCGLTAKDVDDLTKKSPSQGKEEDLG